LIRGKDPADCARTDPVTQPEQFTLNAAMPPARILPSQPHDEIPHVVADRRTTRPVRIRPVPFGKAAMPAQQRGRVTIRCLRSAWGSSLVNADSTARSVQDGRARADLAAQHGDLVAQHQQFRHLGGIASGEKREPAEHTDHDQIEQ
jgi:hypothetical protein